MRRIIVLLAVMLVLLLGVGVLVYALNETETPQFKPYSHAVSTITSIPSTLTTLTITPASLAVSDHATGIIQAFSEQSFTLVNKNGSRVIVVLNDETIYSNTLGTVTFNALDIGQHVDVDGINNPEDRTLVAKHIQILPPLAIISAINGQSLVLTTLDGQQLTLFITNSTAIYLGQARLTSRVFEVGFKINYIGNTTGSGSMTANKLWLVLPHISGTVQTISGNVVQLLTAEGTQHSFMLDSDTSFSRSLNTKDISTPGPDSIHKGSRLNVVINSETSQLPLALLVILLA